MLSVSGLDFAKKKTLIVGKGPSIDAFKRYLDFDHIFTINQVTSIISHPHYAFFLDLEPFLEVQNELSIRKDVKVILPLYPNVRCAHKGTRRSSRSILSLSIENKVLKQLSDEDRLYFYNHEHSDVGVTNSNRDTFKANFVSVTVLLQILAEKNVASIALAGFDGGLTYSNSLPLSRLRSLTSNFDRQFRIFREFNAKINFLLRKVDTMVNIYVGAQDAQYIPARVLEYSIRKHTLIEVNVIRLGEVVSGTKFSGRTPFSGQRFEIPRLNNFAGHAIYLDSDMLVFHDISNLLAQASDTTVSACRVREGVKRRPQYSVMVIDCKSARWDVDAIATASSYSYDKIMFDLDFEPSKSRQIEAYWNDLEVFDENTKLLHFTDMDRQPWISAANPLRDVWIDVLREAVENNFISIQEVIEAIRKGDISPDILDLVLGERQKRRFSSILYAPPHTVARFFRSNNYLTRALTSVALKIRGLVK